MNKVKDHNTKIVKYRKKPIPKFNYFDNFDILKENKLLGRYLNNIDYSKFMNYLNNFNHLNININKSEIIKLIKENENRDFNELSGMFNEISYLFKNKDSFDFSDIDFDDLANLFNECQSIFKDIDIDFSMNDLFITLGALAIFCLTFPTLAATTQCFAGFSFVSFLYNSVVHGIIPFTCAIIIICNSDILCKSASILVKSCSAAFKILSNVNMKKITTKIFKNRNLFQRAFNLIKKHKDIIPSLKRIPKIISNNKEAEKKAKEKEAEMRRREEEKRQKEEVERKRKEAEKRQREEEDRRRRQREEEDRRRRQREEEDRRRRQREEEDRRRRQIEKDIRNGICCFNCHSYNRAKRPVGHKILGGLLTFWVFGIGGFDDYICLNCGHVY